MSISTSADLCNSVWTSSNVHTYHFPFSRLQLADSTLLKVNTNHLLAIFDFVASQCSFFIVVNKTQWTEWILSLVRASAWEHIYTLCYSVSPVIFPYLCPSCQTKNVHSSTLKSTRLNLFTSKHQSRRKWMQIYPNPTKTEFLPRVADFKNIQF